MYLAYTPVETLSADEQFQLATDMVLAALVGEGVYNFGEVIATPVLAALVGSPNQFLHDLVIALNNGDIDVFNSIVEANREAYFSHEVLTNCHADIQQKVVLVAVMNIVFERHSHDRSIPYATIANTAKIPLEQVRNMRNMCLSCVSACVSPVLL
jgi:26S proteasome regulatory subunit N9